MKAIRLVQERCPKKDMLSPIAVLGVGNVSVAVRSSALRREILMLSSRNIASSAETAMKTVLWGQFRNEVANESNGKKDFVIKELIREQSKYADMQIPANADEQKKLLRSLFISVCQSKYLRNFCKYMTSIFRRKPHGEG